MVFYLTITQQASHDFFHPELTNCSIWMELKFSAALANNIEIFIIVRKASTIFVDSARRVRGEFAANNFQQKLHKNSFLTVNASPSNSPGTNWLLLCNRNNDIMFADTLVQSIIAYGDLYRRLSDANAQICQFLEHEPIQSQNSEPCGLFVFILRMLYLVKHKF